MPSAPPGRRWYEVDPIKVVTTVALGVVVMALGTLIFWRGFVARLPEGGRLIPRPDDEAVYDPSIKPIPLVTSPLPQLLARRFRP